MLIFDPFGSKKICILTVHHAISKPPTRLPLKFSPLIVLLSLTLLHFTSYIFTRGVSSFYLLHYTVDIFTFSVIFLRPTLSPMFISDISISGSFACNNVPL